MAVKKLREGNAAGARAEREQPDADRQLGGLESMVHQRPATNNGSCASNGD